MNVIFEVKDIATANILSATMAEEKEQEQIHKTPLVITTPDFGRL